MDLGSFGNGNTSWIEIYNEDDTKYETHWITLHGRYVEVFTTSSSVPRIRAGLWGYVGRRRDSCASVRRTNAVFVASPTERPTID